MAVAVIDSTVLIGAANHRDQDHGRAFEIMRGIDTGTLPTGRLTNYVIAESMSYIHERQRHGTAVELLDRLSSGAAFRILHTPTVDFSRADEFFHTFEQLSFVDATIAAYMEREGIEYLYSFDQDFDALDHIVRLSSAVNPFE